MPEGAHLRVARRTGTRGRTFEDPDGYRVVLQNAEWP
jgi:hypothetical protein